MTKIAVVPGSFDPITMGHVDVIQRAANIFDEVHVLVVHNPNKVAMLPIAERTGLIQKSLDELPDPPQNVEIASWSVGLLVDYCTEVGANVIVKGIRSQIDVSYETPMAIMNRSLAGVETVFLLPDPANAHVSSTLVREVSEMGGDVTPYVPAPVARFLSKRKPA